MRLKKSIYTYVSKKYNEVIFFNKSSLDILKGSIEDLRLFNSFRKPKQSELNNTIKQFINAGLLIPANKKEKNIIYERNIYSKLMKKERKGHVGYIRISLTQDCNLSCKYCFVKKLDNKNNKSINIQDFTYAITWIIKQNKNNVPVIQYFGGEPLLCMDIIRKGHKMLEDAKKTGHIKDFREELVTNGTLISENVAKYLIAENFNVGVSIDGWQEINDINRVYKDGRGSFKSLYNGIKNYRRYGGEPDAIITPTNNNIYLIPKIVQYLVESMNFKNISINTPQPSPKGWDIDGVEFAKSIQFVWEYCNKKEINLNAIGMHIPYHINNRIPQRLSCMDYGFRNNEGIWGAHVSVNANLSPCVVHWDDNNKKNIYEYKDNQDILNWHYNVCLKQMCEDCIAVNICGGPCSMEYKLRNEQLDTERCKFYKNMVKWVIWR